MVSVSVVAGLAGAGVIESELRKRGLAAFRARKANGAQLPGPGWLILTGPEALCGVHHVGPSRPGRMPHSLVIVAPGASSSAVVSLLSQGALDVITDEDPRLIAARTAALVRRLPADAFEGLLDPQWGSLSIDLRRRLVIRPEGNVPLQPREYELIVALVSAGGAVCRPAQLTAAAWPGSGPEARKRLRTYIHHLRRKLESDPRRPEILVTVRGRGYRLLVPERTRPLPAAHAS